MGRWGKVAKIVNARMSDRGINQRELSEKSGVSPATIRQIQHGVDRQRSRSTLAAISRALGFPEDHLWKISRSDPAALGRDADTVEKMAAADPDVLAKVQHELADLRQRVEAIETRLGE